MNNDLSNSRNSISSAQSQYPLKTLLLVGALALALAVSRWIPHPPNVTLLMAISLWSFRWIKDIKLAVLAPLLGLFIADLVLGFHSSMIFVYLATAGVALLGQNFSRPMSSKSSLVVRSLKFGTFTISASALFFLVTNFGVWAFSGMYSLDLTGLIACFVLAVPFWTTQLVTDLILSGAAWGIDSLKTSESFAKAF